MNLPVPLQQIDRTYVRFGNRKLSYFAGCDYFRLASHPIVLRALAEGVNRYGLNVAASRMTTGNHELYGKLEKSLVQYFGSESAILVSNGYATNLIVAQALAGKFSHVLIDERTHPSLLDAAQIFDCPILKFKHLDVEDLSRVISLIGENTKTILLTDGVFSHDGSLTPLKSYLNILPRNSVLLVDDAHGAGTLGNTGKGIIEVEDIPRSRVIQTITLSKAFGVYGGAILCSHELREAILVCSRMFGGSTPLPLPLANAALAAINILRTDRTLRQRLEYNVAYVKGALSDAGFSISAPPGPVFGIVPKSNQEANALTKRCLANGVFPSFIKYHGGPKTGYFRYAISSEHSKAELNALLEALIGQNSKNL